MDLNQLPKVSDRIYLANALPAFAELEGDVPVRQRAWAIVRYARAADDNRRGQLTVRRVLSYVNPSGISVTESSQPPDIEVAKYEVYWLVEEVGDLIVGGIPIFEKCPLSALALDVFEATWNSLPMIVSRALHAAVKMANPLWAIMD